MRLSGEFGYEVLKFIGFNGVHVPSDELNVPSDELNALQVELNVSSAEDLAKALQL